MSPTGGKSRLTRRQAIAAAGVAGAGAAAAAIGLPRLGEGGSGPPAVPDPLDAASCVLTPEQTEGPFFVDEMLDRADIRASKAGVELNLSFAVFSATADCDPFAGATVDLWQCDAQGRYSDVAQDGTTGQTFLRGSQVTGSDGRASFTTIFPGFYPGRTIHIHVKVRVFDGDSTTYDFSTQIYFEESDVDAVLATSAYARDEPPAVTNEDDGIFNESLIVQLGGDVDDGYTGTVEIGLAGLPDRSIGRSAT